MQIDQMAGPNSRIHHIRKFVASVPPDAARLRLTGPSGMSESQVVPLGEWLPNTVTTALAPDIDERCKQHAASVGRSRCAFSLTWVAKENEEERVIQLKQINVYSREWADAMEQEGGLEYDGSNQSQAAQAQKFAEACMRLMITSHGASLQSLMQALDRLSARNAEVEVARERATGELFELKEALMAMQAELTQAQPEQLTPGQAKALELAERIVPVIVTQLASRKP